MSLKAELEELQRQHEQGAITAEQYAARRGALLNSVVDAIDYKYYGGIPAAFEVRVGTVTDVREQPGGRLLILDGKLILLSETKRQEPIRPGDRMRLAGWPSEGGFRSVVFCNDTTGYDGAAVLRPLLKRAGVMAGVALLVTVGLVALGGHLLLHGPEGWLVRGLLVLASWLAALVLGALVLVSFSVGVLLWNSLEALQRVEKM